MKTEKTYASEKAKHNIFYLLLEIYSFRSESSKEKKNKRKSTPNDNFQGKYKRTWLYFFLSLFFPFCP